MCGGEARHVGIGHIRTHCHHVHTMTIVGDDGKDDKRHHHEWGAMLK